MDQASSTSSRARAMSSSVTSHRTLTHHDAHNIDSKHAEDLHEDLHDLLRERKARNLHIARSQKPPSPKRRGRDDSIFDEDYREPIPRPTRLYESSPVRHPNEGNERGIQHDRRASQAGPLRPRAPSMPKAMGARELDQHLDKLNKQNFDLKLELHHRRERMVILESKLEAANQLEQQNQELQDENETLLAEIGRKNTVLDEAVDMISALEDKVKALEEKLLRMEEAMVGTRPSTGPQDSAYFTGDIGGTVPPSSPPRIVLPAIERPSPAKHISRHAVPAAVLPRPFTLATPEKDSLTSPHRMAYPTNNKSTSAGGLRSLYVDSERRLQSRTSFTTLMSGREDDGNILDEVLDSPRLSVLSEISFWSMYGRDRPAHSAVQADEGHVPEEDNVEDETIHLVEEESPKKRRIARVNRWVEERHAAPSRSVDLLRTLSASPIGLHSTDRIVNAHLRSKRGMPTHSNNAEYDGRSIMAESKAHKDKITTPTLSGPLFGTDILPPTPDTMSIQTQALKSSHSSIDESASVNDGKQRSSKPFQSMIPVRPSSSSRPQTSLSMEIAQQQYSQDEAYDDLQSSDGEYETTRVKQDYSTRPFMDYPSGGSISKGTPGRFLGSMGHSFPDDLMFDRQDISHVQPSYTAQSKLQRQPNFVRRDSLGKPHHATGRKASTSTAGQSNVTVTPTQSSFVDYRTSAITVPSRSSSGRQTHSIDTPNSKLPRSSLKIRVPSLGSGSQTKRNNLTQRLFRRSGSSPEGDLPTLGSIDAPANPQSLGRSVSMRIRPSSSETKNISPSVFERVQGVTLGLQSPSNIYRHLRINSPDDAHSSPAPTSRILTPNTERSSNRSESSSTLNAPPVALTTQHSGVQRPLMARSASRQSEASGTMDSGSSMGRGRKWSFGAVGAMGERIIRRASARRNGSGSRGPSVGGGDGKI